MARRRRRQIESKQRRRQNGNDGGGVGARKNALFNANNKTLYFCRKQITDDGKRRNLANSQTCLWNADAASLQKQGRRNVWKSGGQ